MYTLSLIHIWEQAENNKLLSEKLDKHKEEVKQQMAEQVMQIRADMREYMNTCLLYTSV